MNEKNPQEKKSLILPFKVTQDVSASFDRTCIEFKLGQGSFHLYWKDNVHIDNVTKVIEKRYKCTKVNGRHYW